MSSPFIGNSGGQYLVVFRSGARVRLDVDEIKPSADSQMLLFLLGDQVVGSVEVVEVAGMFNMKAIEDYGSGSQS